MIRFVALWTLGSIAGYVCVLVFDWPYDLLALAVTAAGIGLTFDDVWSRLFGGVRYVDLSGLGRECNLPQGWVVLQVERLREAGSLKIVSATATIASLRTKVTFEGAGETVHDAVAQAMARARLAGAMTHEG